MEPEDPTQDILKQLNSLADDKLELIKKEIEKILKARRIEAGGSNDEESVPEDVDVGFLKNSSNASLVPKLKGLIRAFSNATPQDKIATSIPKNNFEFVIYLSKCLETETNPLWILLYEQLLSAMGELVPDTYKAICENGGLNWIIRIAVLDDEQQLQQTLYSLMFLAMMCSQKFRLPESELRKLDADFIDFLLDTCLKHVDNTDDLVLVTALQCLICANCQFDRNDNKVLLKLLAKNNSVSLGNQILLLLNRLDPVSYKPTLKLLGDMFFNPATADFFFTNDLHVLIDILIREVNNSEIPEIRPIVLEILLSILTNHPNYSKSDMYKKSEIAAAVKSVLEAFPQTDPSYKMAERIVLECSHL